MRRPKVKNYYKPTPVKMRKLGDAMMGASTFAATSWTFLFEANARIGIAIMAIGVVGKFITNFFTDETSNKNHDQGAHGCHAEPGAR